MKEDNPTCPKHNDSCHEDNPDSRVFEVIDAIKDIVRDGDKSKSVKWLDALHEDLEDQGGSIP